MPSSHDRTPIPAAGIPSGWPVYFTPPPAPQPPGPPTAPLTPLPYLQPFPTSTPHLIFACPPPPIESSHFALRYPYQPEIHSHKTEVSKSTHASNKSDRNVHNQQLSRIPPPPPPAASSTQSILPTPPYEAQTRDGVAFTVYHVCKVCHKPRSVRYHQKHPVREGDRLPQPRSCNRCRKNGKVVVVEEEYAFTRERETFIPVHMPRPPDDQVGWFSKTELHPKPSLTRVRTIIELDDEGDEDADDSSEHDSGPLPSGSRQALPLPHTEPERRSAKPTAQSATATHITVRERTKAMSKSKPSTKGFTLPLSPVAGAAQTMGTSTWRSDASGPAPMSQFSMSRPMSEAAKAPQAATDAEVTMASRSSKHDKQTSQPSRSSRSSSGRQSASVTPSMVRKIAHEEVERYRYAERRLEAHPRAYAHGVIVPVQSSDQAALLQTSDAAAESRSALMSGGLPSAHAPPTVKTAEASRTSKAGSGTRQPAGTARQDNDCVVEREIVEVKLNPRSMAAEPPREPKSKGGPSPTLSYSTIEPNSSVSQRIARRTNRPLTEQTSPEDRQQTQPLSKQEEKESTHRGRAPSGFVPDGDYQTNIRTDNRLPVSGANDNEYFYASSIREVVPQQRLSPTDVPARKQYQDLEQRGDKSTQSRSTNRGHALDEELDRNLWQADPGPPVANYTYQSADDMRDSTRYSTRRDSKPASQSTTRRPPSTVWPTQETPSRASGANRDDRFYTGGMNERASDRPSMRATYEKATEADRPPVLPRPRGEFTHEQQFYRRDRSPAYERVVAERLLYNDPPQPESRVSGYRCDVPPPEGYRQSEKPARRGRPDRKDSNPPSSRRSILRSASRSPGGYDGSLSQGHRVAFASKDDIATLPALPTNENFDYKGKGMSRMRHSRIGRDSDDYDQQDDDWDNEDRGRRQFSERDYDDEYHPEPKYDLTRTLSESPSRERSLNICRQPEPSSAHGPYHADVSPSASMEVLSDAQELNKYHDTEERGNARSGRERRRRERQQTREEGQWTR